MVSNTLRKGKKFFPVVYASVATMGKVIERIHEYAMCDGGHFIQNLLFIVYIQRNIFSFCHRILICICGNKKYIILLKRGYQMCMQPIHGKIPLGSARA